jgi:hypothetical protein
MKLLICRGQKFLEENLPISTGKKVISVWEICRISEETANLKVETKSAEQGLPISMQETEVLAEESSRCPQLLYSLQ